jgi:hypothetical protein
LPLFRTICNSYQAAVRYSLVNALPPTPAGPLGMWAAAGAASPGMMLHHVRESAVSPNRSRGLESETGRDRPHPRAGSGKRKQYLPPPRRERWLGLELTPIKKMRLLKMYSALCEPGGSTLTGRAFLSANDLKSSDHIPVAALGIVSKLLDRVSGRYALDASLFGRNMFIARYDERSRVTGHCTPKGAHMLPQEHLRLGVPCSTPSYPLPED